MCLWRRQCCQNAVDPGARVQANANNAALYIMRHDVDLENPICWLEKGPAGHIIPNLDQMVNPVRMVLQPFQLHFNCHTALAPTDAAHASRAPVEYLQMNVRPQLDPPARQTATIQAGTVYRRCLSWASW